MKKILSIFFILNFSFCLFAQSQNETLEKELMKRYKSEQAVRMELSEISNQYSQASDFNEKMENVINKMHSIDVDNQLFVSNLLDSIGSWPKGLSPDANMAVFMIIQHGSPDYMNKYAAMVKEGYQKEFISPDLYAIYEDRLLMHADKKQMYGSQTYNGYVWPIEDIDNLDERRAKMNLPPMQEYLKIFEENGIEIIWDKDKTIDDIKKTSVQYIKIEQ